MPALPHTGRRDCWCEPKVAQNCPICKGSTANPACSRCDGKGIVPPYDDGSVLVIHRKNRIRR